MSTTTTGSSPLTERELHSFHTNGFLQLPAALGADELAAVRADMDALMKTPPGNEDFAFSAGHLDGEQVLRRIEYVIDKSPAARAMMGNPRVLRAAEQLGGRDIFPTQDAMVLKMPGQGIAVPWHRDRASTDDYPAEVPVFIADFYLDDADQDTCLWVVPGSHRWPDARARAAMQQMNAGGFATDGAQRVLLSAGDVLLHNVRLLHGSPPNESSKLRRVIYYTIHTVHVEWEHGPHSHEYIAAKQRVLRACIRERQQTPYGAAEQPFAYDPPAQWDKGPLGEGERPDTFRYPAKQYQRT